MTFTTSGTVLLPAGPLDMTFSVKVWGVVFVCMVVAASAADSKQQNQQTKHSQRSIDTPPPAEWQQQYATQEDRRANRPDGIVSRTAQ